MAAQTHKGCELKIAMLEDDNKALKAELLLAYQEVERCKHPLHFLETLMGGEIYEFKYSPEELRALDKG